MAVERRRSKDAGGKQRARQRLPTISIVGAGRLGTALARALAAHDYTIEAVVAKCLRHARRAAGLVGTRTLVLSSTQLDRLPSSDILFITTPDDMISDAAEKIAATLHDSKKKGSRRARTALHASGALSSAVLQSLNDAGFATGSMHPLVSVSDPVQGAVSLSSAFFGVEGNPSAIRVARSLVRSLGAQSFSMSADKKALYHAAAVVASGHTTALFDIAMEMLSRCGLTKRRARAVLLPLLRSTLENLYTNDPAHALTGTFARADTATVRRHLAALRSHHLPEALAAYLLLGQRSLQLAKSAGARPEALKEIGQVLTKSPTD
jgi:predicted short-subunit dehydrogenase-like oxidoreductase (DUF2520 family)